MQNITVKSINTNADTYSIFDYTVEYAVTIMTFEDSYMVYGAVHHEDYNKYVENDTIFNNAGDAFEALKNHAFARLTDYDARKMCELLSELVRMWDAY